MSDPRYDIYMGRGPKQLLHWEHWSCPDAETYLTGIDYYDHPKLCRQKLRELYPQLGLGVPETDDPRPRPKLDLTGDSSDPDRHTVRWGEGETATWEHGEAFFKTAEDVFSFSPLEHGDFSDFNVVEAADFSSEEIVYERYRSRYPADAGERGPEAI